MSKREVHFIPACHSKEEWDMVDQIPYRGEMLIEIGGERPYFKLGDGLLPYRDLPYVNSFLELVNGIWYLDGENTGLKAGLTPEENTVLTQAALSEKQRLNAESVRVANEIRRNTEEANRKLLAASLENIRADLEEISGAHVSRILSDLYDQMSVIKRASIEESKTYIHEGALVRPKYSAADGTFTAEPVGFLLANDIKEHAIDNPHAWGRLTFKVKATGVTGRRHILVYAKDNDQIAYALELREGSGMYMLDVYNAKSIVINTMTAPNVSFEMWDFHVTAVDGLRIKNDVQRTSIQTVDGSLRFTVQSSEPGYILMYSLSDDTVRYAVEVNSMQKFYSVNVGTVKDIVVSTLTLPTADVKLEWRR